MRGRKKKKKEKKMIVKTTMDIDVRNKELSAWFKELGMYRYLYKLSSICVQSRQKNDFFISHMNAYSHLLYTCIDLKYVYTFI